MHYRNTTALLLLTVLAIVAAAFWLGSAAPTSAQAAPAATIQDLIAAGYTDPVVQAPTANAFQPPAVYFRVKEKVASPDAEAPDLVMTWIFRLNNAEGFTLEQPKIENFAGKISACSTQQQYYICAIGPDQAKVLALLDVLKKKIQ